MRCIRVCAYTLQWIQTVRLGQLAWRVTLSAAKAVLYTWLQHASLQNDLREQLHVYLESMRRERLLSLCM